MYKALAIAAVALVASAGSAQAQYYRHSGWCCYNAAGSAFEGSLIGSMIGSFTGAVTSGAINRQRDDRYYDRERVVVVPVGPPMVATGMPTPLFEGGATSVVRQVPRCGLMFYGYDRYGRPLYTQGCQ